MGILLTLEEVREIRKKQGFLDPYPSADRENAMIGVGAKAQLKKDFELWLKPNCRCLEAMPFQTVTIPTKLYQALLKEVE